MGFILLQTLLFMRSCGRVTPATLTIKTGGSTKKTNKNKCRNRVAPPLPRSRPPHRQPPSRARRRSTGDCGGLRGAPRTRRSQRCARGCCSCLRWLGLRRRGWRSTATGAACARTGESSRESRLALS
ncbi:hypothetical protein BDR26DRAFT_849821, partial [Obelidium mucronatum]